jgi:hypothetical protein
MNIMNSKAYVSLLVRGSALLTAFLLFSCSQDDLGGQSQRATADIPSDGRIMFNVGVSDNIAITRSTANIAQSPMALTGGKEKLWLLPTVEPTASCNNAATRGTQLTPTDKITEFGVSAFKHEAEGYNIADCRPDYFYDEEASEIKDSNNEGTGVWQLNKVYYWPDADEALTFNAYYPYGNAHVALVDKNDETKLKGPQRFTVTVDPDAKKHVDFMTATTGSTPDESFKDNAQPGVNLTFQHHMTAIRFVLGDQFLNGYIKSITFSEVFSQGVYTIGSGWTTDDADKENVTVGISYSNKSVNGVKDQVVTGSDETFLLIPQTFSANDAAKITIVFNDGFSEYNNYTVEASLAGQAAWVEGTTVTYAISSLDLTKLKISSIEWPDESGANAWAGPKADFEDGDEVGLYVVAPNGTTVLNQNVRCSYNGGSWTVHHDENNPVYMLPGRQYFFYYPYTSDANEDVKYPTEGLGTTDTQATSFFSRLIADWVPESNQANSGVFYRQDLQVGKGVATNTAASTVSVAMAHQMNIAKITLASKVIDSRVTYKLSTDANYTWVHSGSLDNIVASSDFDTNIPYYDATSESRYFVFKPVANAINPGTLLKGMRNNNVDWTYYLQETARGILVEPEVKTNMTDTKSTETYTMALGDVFYSDGAISKATSKYVNYTDRTIIGIVAYIANDAYTEKNYGGGHALVLSIGPESNNARQWGNNGYTKVDIPTATNVNSTTTMLTATPGYEIAYVYVPQGGWQISTFPALYYGIENGGRPYPTPKGPGGKSTGWFLPSISQWCKVICAMGGISESVLVYNSNVTGAAVAVTNINTALSNAGGTQALQNGVTNGVYWTSSDHGGADAVNLRFMTTGISFTENGYGNYKADQIQLWSMLAF